MSSKTVLISKQQCYETYKLVRKMESGNGIPQNTQAANINTLEAILSHHGVSLRGEPSAKVIMFCS